MGGMRFISEEFGEVDIEDVPCSEPPKVIKSFFEAVKDVMKLPTLKMKFISIKTAKRYIQGLKRIGQIGWGSSEKQLICVVESDGGASNSDPISETKKVIIHEAIHTLGFEHGKEFDEKENYYRREIFALGE